MRFNNSFTVTFRISAAVKDNGDFENAKEDIDIEFDLAKAEAFLFRFHDEAIALDNYKLIFNYTANHQISAIYLQDARSKVVYIVLNPKQVIMDVIKGYRYCMTVDKVIDVMEYDFRTALNIQDDQDIEDEFPTE